MAENKSKAMDFANEWKYTKDGEQAQYCYCKFCDQHITTGIQGWSITWPVLV